MLLENQPTDYDDVLIDGSDPLMDYPILQRLRIVPAALLTSEFAEGAPGAAIVNAPWMVVFLTSGDNKNFCSMFQTELRDPLNKSTDDDDISPSRKILPIIRCITDPDPNCPPDLKMSGIENCLDNLLGTILNKNGVIFVNNIPEEYYRVLSLIIKKYNRKHSIFLLGKPTNQYAVYLEKQKLAEILPDNCDALWEVYASAGGQDDNQNEHLEIIDKRFGEVKKIMLAVSKSDASKISHFGELLTIENAGIVPQIERGDIPSDYRHFLDRSVGGFPNWYWYSHSVGYHLHRTEEEKIWHHLCQALKAADHSNQTKPLLLYGQAYSGKTNILCSLAWRMFSQSCCPVIYIPYAILPSDLQEITESLAYLLKKLEQLEISERDGEGVVVPALIVYDCTCRQASDLNIALKLLNSLRQRGRQVQMICSSYECGKDRESRTYREKEIQSYWDEFDKFYIRAQLDPSEKETLSRLLHDKGGFTKDEIAVCVQKFVGNPHFIAMLYRFGELHDEIQRHIGSEIDGENCRLEVIYAKIIEEGIRRDHNDTMNLLLSQVEEQLDLDTVENQDESNSEDGFRERMDNLLVCLAFCTFYGYAMPMTLVVRILEENFPNPYDIYIAVSSHSIMREQSDLKDELQLKIRSGLEAELLLNKDSKRRGHDCRIDLLLMLIGKINFSNAQEVELIRKLIQSIGPNCKMMNRDTYCLWHTQRERFPEIWGILQNLRKEKLPPRDANKLLPQELSLIREYYRDNPNADRREMAEALIEASQTAQNVLARHLPIGGDETLEINIIVEYCKLVGLSIEKGLADNQMRIREDLYHKNRQRLYELGVKKDDDYARSTLLEIGCAYYELLVGIGGENYDKAIKLLAELFDYCSKFETNADYSVLIGINKIYQKIDYFQCNNEYFERSLAAKDPTGLYLKVIQEKRIIDTLPEVTPNRNTEIKKLAQTLLNKFLLNMRYKELIYSYPPLVRILIQMLWMSYTGWEIIPKSGEERRRTKLTNNQWHAIFHTCSVYIQFGERAQIDPVIRYLHALSALALGEYNHGIQLLRNLYQQISRRGNWYLICDETGEPRTFRGELDKKDIEKSWGFLKNVYPIHGNNAGSCFSYVKFLPEDLGWTLKDCEARYKGRRTTEFWISVSFSGLEVVKPERRGK